MYDRNMVATSGGDKRMAPIASENMDLRAFAAQTPVSPAQGEIGNALAKQENATCELTELVDILNSKLSPVLIPPSPPSSDRQGGESVGYGSPIAICVQANTDRVRQAGERLKALIRDLAV